MAEETIQWDEEISWDEPSAPKEAPSGFLKGLVDPFAGTAQLIGKGLSAAGIPYGDRLVEFYTQVENQYEQDRKAAGESGIDWARVGGNIVNPANVAVAGRVGQIAGLTAPIKAAVTGGATAAMSPTSSDEFASEKGQQVLLGTALGPVGEYASARVGRVISPNLSKEEQIIRELGVTPTPGQSVGGQPKALEEFAENLPVVGGTIREAKQQNIVKFNQGVINQKLNSVKESLPKDLVGNEAVDYAYKIKDAKYDEVLSNVNLSFGLKDKAKMKSLVLNSKLYDKAEGDKAQKILDIIAFSKIPQGSSTLDANVFKSIDSELKSEIFSLKNSGDLADRRVGLALESAQKYFREMFSKQFPEKSSALRRVDKLDKDLRVIRTAAASSGAEKGVFTPKQYQSAVRMQDKTRGKASFGRGKATGQDIAQAGLEILGEETDAILQGRLAGQAAGGIVVATNPALAAIVASAIKFGYSPAGLRVLDALVAKRPQFAVTLGDAIKRNAGGLGGLTSQELIEAYNKAENM